MGSLDFLIDDNKNPENKELKLVNNVEQTMDDNSDLHTDVTVTHGVDKVHEFPDVSTELFNSYVDKLESYNYLNKNGFVSKASVEGFNKIFNNKILEKISIEYFTELLTKVNANKVLTIMKEDLNEDRERIKTQVMDTFTKFEETYTYVNDNKDTLINKINSQIEDIDSLITNKKVSDHPNRIFYNDDSDNSTDYGTAPIKYVVSEGDYASLINILNNDLLLFIDEVIYHIPPRHTLEENDNFDPETFKSKLSLKTLEIFYQSDDFDSSFAILNSYIMRAKDIIDECKEHSNNYDFQLLMTKLSEANEAIANLRFSKNILEGLVLLNNWFIERYKSIQDLL